MRRKNWESDFVVKMQLPESISGGNWRAEWRTNGSRVYVAECIDGVTVNAKSLGGGVWGVIFKDHKLNCGRLTLKFTTWRNSEVDAMVELREVKPSIEDVELVDGPSDDDRDAVSLEVLLTYGVQDVYGIVKSAGYKGTKEEMLTTWVSLLSGGAGSGGSGNGGLTDVRYSDVRSDDGSELLGAALTRLANADDAMGKKIVILEKGIEGKADVGHTHSGYATKGELEGKADVEHTHSEYATKGELEGKADVEHTHSDYATKSELEGKADVEHTHSDYATKSELEGKASQEYVREQVANVEVDTSLFYDKSAVDALVEAARVSLNLTSEQLAGLTVNLTPLEKKIAEVNLFSVSGKKLLVIGDSLSSNGAGEIGDNMMGSWCKYVKQNLTLSADSRSIANGGATVTDRSDTQLQVAKTNWSGSNNVISNQVYSLIDHYTKNKGTETEFVPDIIMLMAGTNNINTVYPYNYWDTMMGDWEALMYDYELTDADYKMLDTSTDDGAARYSRLKTYRNKVYGAWRWIIESLLTNFPNTYIYIMQPLQNGNGRGKNIFKYYEYLEKIAKFYSIPLIRTADECFLSYFSNMRSGKGWSGPWYTFDGTHPDWQGMKLIGNYVSTVVRNTYFEKPAITATKTEQVVEAKYYNITITDANADSSIGSVSPSGVRSVKEGGSLTVTITPATGYKVLKLTLDGSSITPANSYTFSNVVGDHSLLVEFALESSGGDVEEPVSNPPVLNSIIVNGGSPTTVATVPVVMNVSGGTPTHYRIAESSSALSAATWKAWSSNSVNFTLSGTGNKTVYCQVKNADGESVSKSASITYTKPSTGGGDTSGDSSLWTSKIGLGWGWLSDTAAATMVGDSMKLYTAVKQMNIYSTTGATVGTVTKNIAVNSSSYLKGKITGDDSALIPDALLQNNFCSTCGSSDAELILTFTLAAGTYNVKTLHNISSSADWASYVTSLDMIDVTVNDVLKHPTKIMDNTDTWLRFDNVVVESSIALKFKTNDAAGKNMRSTITGIIIEKIG